METETQRLGAQVVALFTALLLELKKDEFLKSEGVQRVLSHAVTLFDQDTEPHAIKEISSRLDFFENIFPKPAEPD